MKLVIWYNFKSDCKKPWIRQPITDTEEFQLELWFFYINKILDMDSSLR